MHLSYLMAIFLGLVQGIAEFLPISSSGHLSLLQNFFGVENIENENVFFSVCPAPGYDGNSGYVASVGDYAY